VLTVADLVDHPGLGLELVAGVAGAQQPIRWLTFTEEPDPTPWLRGGELLITTGLALKDDETCRRFVGLVHAVPCPGLGFGLGLGHDVVPAALRELADELGFPVFTIPYELPFVAVTEVAMTRLVNEQAHAMRRALDVHDRLTALVLEERGLDALVQETARLTGFAVRLRDERGEHLAASGWPDEPAPERPVCVLEIRSPDGLEATLEAAVPGRALSEADEVLLGHARTVLAVELLKRRAVRETERRLAGDLLDELLDGALPERELARRTALHGLSDEAPLTFALVRLAGAAARADRVAVDTLAALGVRAVAAPRDGALCVLYEAPTAELAEEHAAALMEAMRTELGEPAAAGVGAPRGRRSELRQSHDEARYALEASAALGGARVGTPADLGSLRLILSLQESRGLELFCDAVLGPLELHDRRSNAHLCESLEAYIEANGRWADAAARLDVHRHTLRYRIQRIQELSGRDLQDARDRLELWLALKAREIARRRPPAERLPEGSMNPSEEGFASTTTLR
jgi:PucR family transcriptional regulator, purine catabolism regulatory protein